MKKFLRIKDVIEITSLAKSTIWLWVKEEKFPRPHKISTRVTVWNIKDIQNWIEKQQQK